MFPSGNAHVYNYLRNPQYLAIAQSVNDHVARWKKGVSGFDSWQQQNFIPPHSYYSVRSIQCLTLALLQRAKRPDGEAYHSSRISVGVKNVRLRRIFGPKRDGGNRRVEKIT